MSFRYRLSITQEFDMSVDHQVTSIDTEDFELIKEIISRWEKELESK